MSYEQMYELIQQLYKALLTAEACLYAHGKPIDPAITLALYMAGKQDANKEAEEHT